MWWSSGPNKFLDTMEFDKENQTLRAFYNKALIVGNPEMTMTFAYCQVSPYDVCIVSGT